MRKWLLSGAMLAIVGLLLLASCIVPPGARPYGQPFPNGPGGGMGPGMMGRGGSPGMMGGGWQTYRSYSNSGTSPLTIDQAAEAVRRYLNAYGNKLVLNEVMNFTLNYYAEVEEKDTGIHAMELLIDKYAGQVYPEMGPNMMWNTRYGMMGGGMMGGGYYPGNAPTTNMPIPSEQAESLAQQYLDRNMPGVTVAEADTFYGYYTLHILRNGRIEGMLSVNGYTGAIWYHNWHGSFIEVKEFK